ncbi:hypothetical protein EXN66_Car009848 [Channa argus]|uniref:Uncharacterized protein n=1 Tax=Channa argus TaxID=215402 RepID=A0A6G1PV78_CHAAH|nr:hypothetical protein EXN66_Car009848 [Channa argus]
MGLLFSSLCEEERRKNVAPLWRRQGSKLKSSTVNVTHSCRNPNRNGLARAEQAHGAGQRGND